MNFQNEAVPFIALTVNSMNGTASFCKFNVNCEILYFFLIKIILHFNINTIPNER